MSDDFLGEVELSVTTINEKLAKNQNEIWLTLGPGKKKQDGITGELCVSIEKRSVDKNIQGVEVSSGSATTTTSATATSGDTATSPTTSTDATSQPSQNALQNAASITVVRFFIFYFV